MSAFLELSIGTAVPTAATDGVTLSKGAKPGKPQEGFRDTEVNRLVFFYRATVNAGQVATMSFLRLWGFSRIHSGGGESATGDWYPIGPALATDANRGELNSEVALGEIATDKINLTQVVNELGAFERIYLQEGTSGGTGYASKAFLVASRSR